MRLSLRQKQDFYHELGQFLKAGASFPQALESMVGEGGAGAARQLAGRLLASSRAGNTVAESFSHARPAIGELELSLITAASTSGRVDGVLAYLSTYFAGLDEVRASLVKQLSWPVIQLFLGVLISGLPSLFQGTTLAGYLLQSGGFLLVVCLIGALAAGGGLFLARLSGRLPAADRVLRRLPLIGKLRTNLVASRFCSVYEMQLQAAINVMDALRAAARASHSALLSEAVEGALPKIRGGAQVAEVLTAAAALPAPLLRAMRMAEETGGLDAELQRWAAYYHQASVRNLEALGRWLPKIINLIIVGYLGYKIVTVFMDSYVKPINKLLDE